MIDRPERNAVDGPTAAALADAFRAFDADASLHVAVLYGAGGTFCAGADLKAIGTERGNRSPGRRQADGADRIRLSKPVVAAIEGHAVAGGLELALWCDLRVAAGDASSACSAAAGACRSSTAAPCDCRGLIGVSRAMDLVLLTGRPVDAWDAERMGLVNRVVPVGQAQAEAEALAHAGHPAAGVPAPGPALAARAGRPDR